MASVPDALAGHGFQHGVGCRFQPFGAAETGLKGDMNLAVHRFAQQPRSLAAMAMIGIAQLQGALRHAMEAEQQGIAG